jgi:diphosphoinositol-polyphosphate diphosphatase
MFLSCHNCWPSDSYKGYSEAGERLVCGLVPLDKSKSRVLLIQSAKRNGWVLPKGGWETDEATPQEAAKREAWEEAGVICTISKDLGKIKDKRAPKDITNTIPKALYQFYEATVDKEEPKWPESHKRGRKWMSYQEAKALLTSRPELLEALEKSSVKR